MREWSAKLLALLARRGDLDEDLSEEIAAHIDCAAADNIERGMSPADARAAARRHFGNRALANERARQAWTFSAWESLAQEVRVALRGLRRSPGFSFVVIATLALGIGANTAMFSVVYAVLLKPLPFPAGDRLVRLEESTEKVRGFSVSWMNYQHWRQQSHSFEDLAAFEQSHMTFTGREEPLLLRGAAVTPGFFDLIGIRPVQGRLLDANDDQRGAPAVVVLSRDFWMGRLGGKANIVGTNLDLDSDSYQVVGVASSDPGFFLKPSDFWIPLARLHGREVSRSEHGSIRVLGRLRPGASLASAKADVDAVMRHLAEIDPGPENDHRADLVFQAEFSRVELRPTLLMLMTSVGLVLAIACANVASLLLARNTARSREIAIRTAIGAGRLRLIRAMLAESLILTAFGGLAGLLVAYGCLKALIGLAPRNLPHVAAISLEPQVLSFTGAIAILIGLLIGLAPVFATRKLSLVDALKESTQFATGTRAGRSFHSALVVIEIALTLLLVFASTLLLRSLIAAETRSLGFAPGRLLALELVLPSSYKSGESIRSFYMHLTENLRALPGVETAAAVFCPPSGGDCGDWFYSLPDKPTPASGDVPVSLLNMAAPDYFRSMAIPVIEGREFTDEDRPKAPPVAIVNLTFARKWWPGESAVGHLIKLGGPYRAGRTLEIVGVVGDVSQMGVDSDPMDEIFCPFAQMTSSGMEVMVRSSGDPSGLIAAVRHSVSQVDGNVPIQNLAVFENTLSRTLDPRRFGTLLLALFAGLAMALAAVGIYGLLSYWVSIREKDIAIRMALGAQRSKILAGVGRQSLRLAIMGIVMGAIGTWPAARSVSMLLFGISAHSPTTIASAVVAVVALAALASAVPAWRATQVDPLQKLHEG